MNAIFKRELRGLFRCAVGWVTLITLVLAAGIVTTVNNLLSLSSDASRLFPLLGDLLVLLCPLLASHAVTYENSKKNTRWLRSLPLSRGAILGGKYLAALALLGLCAVYFALFPLLIGIWGTVSYGTAYTALLGWVLIAAAVLSVSFLVASRTQSRPIAVLLGALVCLILYLLPLLAALIAAIPWTGILAAVLVAAAFAVPRIVRDQRQSRFPRTGVLILAPTAAVSLLLYFVARPFYTRILPTLLDQLSLFGRLDGFRNGHLDISAVVLLLSVTAVCLVLTLALPEPKFRKKGEGR